MAQAAVPNRWFYFATKRLFDAALAACGLLLTAPLMALVALAVRLALGPPVLFVQERAGLHGRPFRLYKFRTMIEAQDAAGRPLPDEQRLTRLGAFLRWTSLDELPQLWNILRGDMSFVGPRPLPTAYLPLYSPEQARRHEVRPGLTGWAQIHGRNRLSWEERFRLDVWYVDHACWRLDLRILARTLGLVLRGEGVSPEGRLTSEPFRGSTPGALAAAEALDPERGERRS